MNSNSFLKSLMSGSKPKINRQNIILTNSGKSNVKTEKNEKNEKKEKKERVKRYNHGMNVMILKGFNKGYLASIVDFSPATEELRINGVDYIESSIVVNQDISKPLITYLGRTEILDFIPSISTMGDFIELYVYSEQGDVKIGLVCKDKSEIVKFLEEKGLENNELWSTVDNPNNNYIKPLNVEKDDLSDTMNGLSIKTKYNLENLINELSNMNISDDSVNKLIFYTSKSVIEFKPENYDTTEGVYPSIQNKLFNKDIKLVYNKDIIHKIYIVTSGKKIGTVTEYRPDVDMYRVRYSTLLTFKPSDLKKDQNDLRYAFVKTGKYAGKRCKIHKFNHAHITIRLNSTNEIISYLVIIKDGMYISRKLRPSDVFYFDILLENNNVAQVDDTLRDERLKITEKIEGQDSKFISRIISEDEIRSYLAGFKLESDIEKTTRDNLNVLIGDRYVDADEYEYGDEYGDVDEDNDDNVSISGYNENEDDNMDKNIMDEINYDFDDENGGKSSFKDIERTFINYDKVTNEQQSLLLMIKNGARMLHYNVDEYEILRRVESVKKCIEKGLLKVNYKKDIMDGNKKYIIILVIMYDIIKNNGQFKLKSAIESLYKDKVKGKNSKSYFSSKDIDDEYLNNFVFLIKNWGISDASINEALEEINKLLSMPETVKRNREIIKILLLQADSYIQFCLGINVNINKNYEINYSDLIPLGVNKQGKRYRDIEMEDAKDKVKKFKKNYILYSEIDKVGKELEIIWDKYAILPLEEMRLKLLDLYKENHNKDIKYVLDNLPRIPYAINDDVDDTTKNILKNIYSQLKTNIIEYKNKLEKEQSLRNERNHNVSKYRDNFVESMPDEMIDSSEKYFKRYLRNLLKRKIKQPVEFTIPSIVPNHTDTNTDYIMNPVQSKSDMKKDYQKLESLTRK